MKKFVLSLLMLSSVMLSPAAFAGFAQLNGSCVVNPQMATCQVYNHLNIPVFCNARATGMTRFGSSADMFANNWIYPGQYLYISVYPYNPYNDFLVSARAFAHCQF